MAREGVLEKLQDRKGIAKGQRSRCGVPATQRSLASFQNCWKAAGLELT